MKYFFLIIIVASFVKPRAFAEQNKNKALCDAAQSIIFSCPTKQKKWISVCASTNPPVVHYRYGKPGKIELDLPGKDNKPPTFNYLTYSGGGGAYIRFILGSVDYIVYSKTVKGDGDSSGVLILQKDKKAKSILCEKEGDLDAPAIEKLKVKQEETGADPFVSI